MRRSRTNDNFKFFFGGKTASSYQKNLKKYEINKNN